MFATLSARAAAVALAAATLAPAGALAQGQPPLPGTMPQPGAQAPQQQPQRRALTEEKLVTSALAARKVRVAREVWQGKIEAADNEDAANALKKEANKEFAAIVDQSPGISIREYLGIVKAANENPQLAQKINEVIQATQPR